MAIARDTFTNGAFASGTSRTYSHTCTGTDLILFVHVFINTTADRISSVTYAGTPMTLLHKFSPGASRYLYLFALTNPATGANNVVVSASASTAIGSNAFSYTGVEQTSQPEVTRTQSSSADPDTFTITTLTDNSWVALVTLGNNADPTASTGSNFYGQNSVYGDADVFDSGNIATAGSVSMTLDYPGSFPHGGIQVAIAPSGGGGGGAIKPNFLGFSRL